MSEQAVRNAAAAFLPKICDARGCVGLNDGGAAGGLARILLNFRRNDGVTVKALDDGV